MYLDTPLGLDGPEEPVHKHGARETWRAICVSNEREKGSGLQSPNPEEVSTDTPPSPPMGQPDNCRVSATAAIDCAQKHDWTARA